MARTFGDLGNCRTGPNFDEHYKQPLLKMPMMKRKAYLLIKILQMSKYRLRQLSSRAVAFSLFLASSSGSSHSTRISTTLKKTRRKQTSASKTTNTFKQASKKPTSNGHSCKRSEAACYPHCRPALSRTAASGP